MNGDFHQTPQRSRSRSADSFVLTLWTNDPERAGRADRAGVDRIGVDLERLGKEERQRGFGTWISPHSEEDLDAVAAALSRASLFARLNPVHRGSPREVEGALARGARVLMLPMVDSASEAREFARFVGGAATVVLLVETAAGLSRLRELVSVDGVDEVHIGLNDLALSLGVRNRWMALAGDLAVEAGSVVRAHGKRFGLGAVGWPGDRGLPVPAHLVYAQYARTGATAALLARSFFRPGAYRDFSAGVVRLRSELAAWRARSDAELGAAHEQFVRCAAKADCF